MAAREMIKVLRQLWGEGGGGGAIVNMSGAMSRMKPELLRKVAANVLSSTFVYTC